MSKVSDAQLQDILEHIGNNRFIPQVVRQFDKSMLFSTDEKVVGQWVNGKPLYQKTISMGALKNKASTRVNHNIANVDRIVYLIGYTYNPTNGWMYPVTRGGFGSYDVAANANDTVVEVASNADLSRWTETYVTIQYTKTTDTALPYELGDENDYSTTEKLVGKWIDGSDIFQKTIDCGALPNSTTKSVSVGVNNIDKIIDISGVAIGSNFALKLPHTDLTLNDCIQFYYDTDVKIKTKADYSSLNGYATIQYTKTTD